MKFHTSLNANAEDQSTWDRKITFVIRQDEFLPVKSGEVVASR